MLLVNLLVDWLALVDLLHCLYLYAV